MTAIENARATLAKVDEYKRTLERRIRLDDVSDALRDLIVEHERVTSETGWEYGLRADGDEDPYSDVADDLDYLLENWFAGLPDEHVARRRKAGPWEPIPVQIQTNSTPGGSGE